MAQINESQLKAYVEQLNNYLAEMGGGPGQTAAYTAQQQNAGRGAATTGTTTPAPVQTRYKTPQEYDKEIARFSASSNPKLPPNARYIAQLQAEKAALMKQPNAHGAATGTTTQRVAPKPEAWVQELQTKLNAAGEKLKVDGIMGPATRQAQARHPEITTQTAAQQAVGADINSADATPAAPVAPAAPTGMQAQGDDEGNTTITRPDGSTMVVGPNGQQIMQGSNPALPQNQGVVNTVSNWAQNKGQFQKPTGFQPAPAPVQETVSYGQDESLARIVSLVRY
jgi:hypothetical protein